MSSMERPPAQTSESQEDREIHDPRLDSLFGTLAKIEESQKRQLDYSAMHADLAAQHPGEHYDSNIFQMPDGTIWEMTSYPDPGSQEYRHGYQPRGNREDRRRELPEGASRASSDGSSAWAWESIKDINARKEREGSWYKVDRDDRGYWNSSVHDAKRSLEFIKTLVERRGEIEQWAKEYAKGTDRSRLEAYYEDWKAMLEFLKLSEVDFPDKTRLELELAQTLDILVNGKPTERGVAY